MERGTSGRIQGIGVLLVALGASLWGTDALIRQPLVDRIPSTAIVLVEHLLLSLYAIPVLIGSRRFLRGFGWKEWSALLLIAWGASGLATVLFTQAFAQGNPTTAILLQKTQPLIAVILAGTLLKERLPRLYWPYFAVAILGAYLVSFGLSTPWSLSREQVVAAGLALGAAALWGAGTVLGRFLLADVPFATLTAARFFFALPFLAVLALAQGVLGEAFSGIGDFPARFFLLALIPGLLSMLIYYVGLSRARASYATLAELAFPATATILNWIFLGFTVTGWQLAGFVILWLAITGLTRLPSEQRSPASSLATAN